jgi:cytochrome c-type biogenesis protein CcmH
MKRLAVILSLLVVALAPTSPVFAVQPDEVLENPALEARARDISKGLRCLVCRNESIDESNAELARDLRLLVRERLVAGDSNSETLDYIVARYGEYVLLKPRASGSAFMLWAVGPLVFLLGLGGGIVYLRRRARAPGRGETALSSEEQARLREILKD